MAEPGFTLIDDGRAIEVAQAAGVARATVISLHLPQVQAGIRWPHQS